MSKTSILIGLGIWTIVLPYLGFPYYIKNILFLLTGAALIYLAYLLRKEIFKKHPSHPPIESFAENSDFHEKVSGNIEQI